MQELLEDREAALRSIDANGLKACTAPLPTANSIYMAARGQEVAAWTDSVHEPEVVRMGLVSIGAARVPGTN